MGKSWTVPGYDERTRDGGGVHGDEWHYAIQDRGQALHLIVFTTRFPASVTHIPPAPAKGAYFKLHSSWPVNEEQLRNPQPEPCSIMEGDCYDGGTWGLAAEKFFAEHGRDDFQQTPAFWAALRQKLDAFRIEPLEEVRCPRCEGRGVISGGGT